MVHSNNLELFTVRQTSFDHNYNNRRTVGSVPTSEDTHIDGFNVICVFHQLVGLPYYGMKPAFNKFRSFLGIAYSLAFIAIFIASLIPCILICDKENAMRYKSSRINRSQSACIVEILLIGIEAYHTIDNDLGLIYARHEFQHFYKLLKSIVSKHDIVLNYKLKRKLLFTAWALILLNIFNAVLEIILLYPIVNEEINEQSDHDKAHIDLPKKFSLYFTLTIKAIGCIHSKALDTLIIYFSLLLTYYMISYGQLVKEMCTYYEYIHTNPNNKNSNKIKNYLSFDDLRQTFVSLQELTIKANNCLSPCILLTTGCNVIAVLGGLFIGIDLFGQGAKLEEEEVFDLFNALVCTASLIFCGIFGDDIVTQTKIALRQLQRISFNSIDDKDYRSIKELIDSIEETRINSLNGTGFFLLNKRLIFTLFLIIIPFAILLSQKY